MLVGVFGAAGFSLAVARFGEAAAESCSQRVREDPSYKVRFADPPSVEQTRYRLTLTRAGRPVSRADFCINLYMKGMSAMAAADRGQEVAPGIYEVSLTFQMGSGWTGAALVREAGGPLVAVPIEIKVRLAPEMPMDMPPMAPMDMPPMDMPQ